MESSSGETMLAQEQSVTMRGLGVRRELEGAFGFGEKTGTLVLTNKRLIFVCSDEKEEDIQTGYTPLTPTTRLLFSDVEALDEISQDPENISIAFASITHAVGHGGEVSRPNLEIRWNAESGERGAEFTEILTGKRKKNLNDWAPLIQRLKSGTMELAAVPKAPPTDSLEGKIFHVLSDMQEKGLFSIEGEVEEKFKVSLDPDEVQAACDKLAKEGLIDRFPDSGGDVFYRLKSPLGEDDLSS
jgi:hypothetical protein